MSCHRGRGVLDRRAFATGRWASRLDPTIRLELAVHARREEVRLGTDSGEDHNERGITSLVSVTPGDPP